MALSRLARLCLPAVLAPALLLGAPALHAQSAAAKAHAPLQERMSYAEFTRLGLDKLSPTQLKALNAWLDAHGDNGPSVDAVEAQAAQPARRAHGNQDVHTRIKGSFRGWNSDTVFTLANGQRWQVADDSEMMMHSIDNPKVTLHKGFFGSWLLSVDGTDETVRVTPAD